ncbi:MAG: hypothetical protein KKG60_02800, partial [Nanoarchaeota archaeon]|nr:hypothetical protein [Nanoarchaeota archaeon]
RDPGTSVFVLVVFVVLFFVFLLLIKPGVEEKTGLAVFNLEEGSDAVGGKNIVGAIGSGFFQNKIAILVAAGVVLFAVTLIILTITKKRKRWKKKSEINEEEGGELGLSKEEINKLFDEGAAKYIELGKSPIEEQNKKKQEIFKFSEKKPGMEITKKSVEAPPEEIDFEMPLDLPAPEKEPEKPVLKKREMSVDEIKSRILALLREGRELGSIVLSLLKEGAGVDQINKAIDEINRGNLVNYFKVCINKGVSKEHIVKVLLARGWSRDHIKDAEKILKI